MRHRGSVALDFLVVTCVVGLLALTAAPKFTDSQVKEKVAQAKADMQTLATALEAYRLDNGDYPVSKDGNYPVYLSHAISTPVAYVTREYDFVDPFNEDMPDLMMSNLGRYRYASTSYYYSDGFMPPPPYFTQEFGEWRLSSDGPDRAFGPTQYKGQGYLVTYPYDPTNGIISNGDIVRSQKHREQVYTVDMPQ